jgi:ribonuclease HI
VGFEHPGHTYGGFGSISYNRGVTPPPKGDILKYAIQLDFPATNNIAEYEGLVTGYRLAKELGIR